MDALRVLEELWEATWAAIVHEESVACIVVVWAVYEDMFDGFQGLAALAGNLV